MTAPDLSVDVGRGLKLKNPILVASGTFGYGIELTRFFDPAQLGAIVGKPITRAPREGNPLTTMRPCVASATGCLGSRRSSLIYRAPTSLMGSTWRVSPTLAPMLCGRAELRQACPCGRS